MLRILRKKKFDKDVMRIKRRKKDLNKLKDVITHLAMRDILPACYKVHALKGEFFGCRECHIEPDWILIYYIEDDKLVLVRTGSHSDLF